MPFCKTNLFCSVQTQSILVVLRKEVAKMKKLTVVMLIAGVLFLGCSCVDSKTPSSNSTTTTTTTTSSSSSSSSSSSQSDTNSSNANDKSSESSVNPRFDW